MKTYKYMIIPAILNLFDGNTNVTTDNDLSGEMKTFYERALIRLAEPKLVHDQFGQKKPIPKNGGKTIEFRKYDSLPKALTPLTEGVTPDGQKMKMSVLTATVAQYGGFIELSDMLILTAIDQNLVEAMELIASQAGRTLDTITREVLCGGTNVEFAGGKSARYLLVGGAESGNDYLTVDCVKRAVRFLKVMNAEKISGDFVSVIHPDCTYDFTKDEEWRRPHEYVDTKEIYSGEIGKVGGCRFVETTEGKIFHAEDLTAESRNLTVASWTAGTLTAVVDEAISADEALKLAGRKVIINNQLCTVASATARAASAAAIVLTAAPATAPAAGDVVYPGEAGAGGRDVYATLVLGANAYGVTEITGGGLRHIVKQLGSAGTADPLNQRATTGWKATKVAERLVEQYMVRIESASTFESGAN